MSNLNFEPAPDQSYGKALPDQVERIANLFDAHIEVISDVRDLYQSRVALEREYALKLQTLAKKAADKKVKMEVRFIVGEDPTKPWDLSTLQRNTLGNAYNALIGSVADSAQDHNGIADVLASQVVDVMRTLEKKNEDVKKKEIQFYQKLLADRDRAYADRLKSKQKYDADCEQVESFREKRTRATDDKHKKHTAKYAEQYNNDMFNSKNTYLISMAIANNTKDRFYGIDLLTLENDFQRLQGRLVQRLVQLLLHSQRLQQGHLDTLKGRLSNVESKLSQVNPLQDQTIFIEHNLRPFNPPADWNFEPCALHYDTDNMIVETAPKIYIQNKLSKCLANLQGLEPLISSKQSEFDRLAKKFNEYTADNTVGTMDELIDSYLEAQHQLTSYQNSRAVLQAEIETVRAAIGDDEGLRSPHAFKSSSFSIPTQCGYCESSIWGLSKQGKTCKLCGLSVHNKCELKVPADCPAADPSGSILSRKTTSSSRTSSSTATTPITPTPSSFVQPQSIEEADFYPTAKVLFDFTPSSEFELAVHEGMTVRVIEPDDGSGWVKVKVNDTRGKSGLVPASYIGDDERNSSEEVTAAHQKSGERVRAIYPYQSQGPDELGLQDGEILELSVGGKEYGNGWWEGYNSTGQKGVFPSNYVELL